MTIINFSEVHAFDGAGNEVDSFDSLAVGDFIEAVYDDGTVVFGVITSLLDGVIEIEEL